jgi:hypothetical protein
MTLKKIYETEFKQMAEIDVPLKQLEKHEKIQFIKLILK